MAYFFNKSMIKPLVSLAIVATLSSCVTIYKLPEGYTGPTATIKDTAIKTGNTKAEAFEVSKIEGQIDTTSPMATPRGGGMFVYLQESKRTVPAGKPITLTIEGGDIYAADGAALADMMSGNAKKVVTGDVVFTPKPNGSYKVNGIAGKESSSVWVEDESNGKLVTRKITND
jgi:hypothetical protein